MATPDIDLHGRTALGSGSTAALLRAERAERRATNPAVFRLHARGGGCAIFVASESGVPTRSEGVATFVKQVAAQGGVGETEMERQFFATTRRTSLARRFITVEEVRNAIVYLRSAVASATTGTAMRVDGGAVRAIP